MIIFCSHKKKSVVHLIMFKSTPQRFLIQGDWLAFGANKISPGHWVEGGKQVHCYKKLFLKVVNKTMIIVIVVNKTIIIGAVVALMVGESDW